MWVSDTHGNKCSSKYFGSEQAAREALESLNECRNCINCSCCSRCSCCSGCSRCSCCSRCSGCSGCSGCSRCSGCSDCAGCLGCSDCSGKIDNKYGMTPIIVPKIPNIHAAVYAAASNPGSLEMGYWHKCAKTHCRAGWVVTLGGEDGAKLESRFNTELAAMLIYVASSETFHVSPARFFDDNERALVDMKRLANLEAEG